MTKVIGVRFRTAGKIYFFSPGKREVETGDKVIVETARGVEFGSVVTGPKEVEDDKITQPLKSVIRLATDEDKKKEEKNKEKEKEAFKICLEKIHKHGLEMKLIDAEYTFDNNKVLFYFTADGRIDFRELVKDLASVFRTRIELRQIGVRDETKIRGGIGICGRPLCCHTYLSEFAPVSIKMAKEQNLSVNPTNPATYTGVFDLIRDLFAATPDAKARGYKKGRFSFNVKGGRCEACSGDGIIKIEMHFLPDVYVPCEVCKGRRYNRETLEVKYKGKNIYDVLDMTVEEAMHFFENVPSIRRKMETLYDVGLSYIRLGQPSTTLSGGEAQRIKLATELSKRSTGKTIYILDEPTTGLHFADVHKLTEILHRLTEDGNTVIVIEHNLDVIKTADYIIDIGPEGGDKGGTVIAEGTPEEVAKSPVSYTGKYIKPMLER